MASDDGIERRFFRQIAERAQGEADIDVDAIEAFAALGIPAVDLFAFVEDLLARGLLMESPEITWGALMVRLTSQGVDTFAREQSP